MIDQKEWANWVGNGSLPATISMPLSGADPRVGESVANGFEVLNRAFKHYSAVSKDPALSPGERARALAQGQTFINAQVGRAVNAATAQFKELSERATRERDTYVKGTMGDDLALGLALQVRQLGKTIISTDPRFMQAVNRVPAAVSGLDNEADVAMHTAATIERHNPDLALLERSVAQSKVGVERLEKVALHLAGVVAQSIDKDALLKDSEFKSLLG